MKNAGPWYKTFFHDSRVAFDSISRQRTADEVRYIIAKLGLKKGSRFLDCPCGIGRISLPLAARGIRVTGADLTGEYLDELAGSARRRKLRIELVQADMRRVRFDHQFDAAGNIGSSIGYFTNDAEEMKTLRAMYRALKPGGKFLLNVRNRDSILADFDPSEVVHCGDVTILQERTFDFTTSVNRCVWRFLKDGQMSTHHVDIRLYSYHELASMLRKAGFVDVVAYGGTKDEPISQHRLLMWVIGTKPKR